LTKQTRLRQGIGQPAEIATFCRWANSQQ